MTIRRKGVLLCCVGATAGVAVLIACCYMLVTWNASGRTYDKLADVPYNKYGLLLATSPFTAAGDRNLHFENRIKAAELLYKQGKVDTIIASGGNYSSSQHHGYDEPRAIRDSLMARGVPEGVILLDYNGTRTICSIVNAKRVYDLDSVTLISQKYHNERAIYLADRYGVASVGYNAEPSPVFRKRVKNTLREYLARVKMMIDLIFD